MAKDDILKEIRDRFKESYDAVDELYEDCIDDLRFIDGEQWPTELLSSRQADGRPCLVINKMPAFCNQVIGDIRQNEPQVKIKPVDSKADPKTAEILTGLIRNIEVCSDADVAYDTAMESAVRCGVGAWRIGTEYVDDAEFDQDIVIQRIRNPFTIYWDPAAEKFDKSDARWVFVTEKVPKEEFERLWPDKTATNNEGGHDDNLYWGDDKNVRVVEYFKREPVKKTLYLVQNAEGQRFVTFEAPDAQALQPLGWTLLNEREVDSHKIVWYKACQGDILEGPTEWVGKYFPICMVFGEEYNIEGRTIYKGLIRNTKDPQRLYNFSRSSSAEMISLAPKAPYLVTARQIANYQNIWESAHKKSHAYLPYDIDPQAPTVMPRRVEPVVVNSGIRDEIMISDQEMHDTSGLQLASLGKKSNEQSGRAIIARQREGDVGNYTYYDNLSRAIKYTGKVILDLIPKIYDTERIIRIINPDGSDKQVPVNQPFMDKGPNGEEIQRIYDLSVGKYDVVVSLGPAYSTQREEAASMMVEFMKVMPPEANMLIADLLAENMDWPKAKEISDRLKILLPPQLQATPEDGGPPPAAPPPPDPMQIIAIKQAEAQAQGAALDVEEKFHRVQRLKQGLPPEPKEIKPVAAKSSKN